MLTRTGRDLLAAQHAEDLREVHRLEDEVTFKERIRLLRDKQERENRDKGEKWNPDKIIADEEQALLSRKVRDNNEALKQAWMKAGASARALSDFDAEQFKKDLGNSNRAVGAATIVVAGILVQAALQSAPIPSWFGWGFLWAALGITFGVVFYLGRGAVNFYSWWRLGSVERFKLFKVSFQRGVTGFEIAMFLAQLVFLGMAVVVMLHGLQVPGFRSWP